MKIRIKGNSVRYRLTKTDIDKLANDGYLQEKTNFAGKTLFYVLKGTTGDVLASDFIGDSVVVFMPEKMIKEWIETDKVGFRNTDGPVQLLLEKDFSCLENVEEDQSDNYPNPLAKNNTPL